MLRDIGGFSTFQVEILIFIPQQSSSKFKFLAPSLTVKWFTFFLLSYIPATVVLHIYPSSNICPLSYRVIFFPIDLWKLSF